MATGGRVLHYLAATLPDPRNTMLFVGYQAAGTRGRQLVDGVEAGEDARTAHRRAGAHREDRFDVGACRRLGDPAVARPDSPGRRGSRIWCTASRRHRRRWPRASRPNCSGRRTRPRTARRSTSERSPRHMPAPDSTRQPSDHRRRRGGTPLSPRARRRGGRRAALRRRLRAAVASATSILCWHLYQAALAGRDIYYDQRYAHNLEMRAVLEAVLRHPAGVEPQTLAAIAALHEAVLDQHRPVQQPDRAKVRAGLHAARRSRPPWRRPSQTARALPLRDGESRRGDLLARLAPAVLRSRLRAGRDEQDARAGPRHPARPARTTSTSACPWRDLDGFDERYPLNSRLVKRRDGGLVEEVYRVGGRYGARDRPHRRASRGGDRRTRRRRWRARSRRWSASTGPARPRRGAPTTSRGWPTSSRTWTPSTGSSRSTWTRAA